MSKPEGNPYSSPDNALPSFKLVLFKVTSVVIYTNRSRVVFTGTMPVLEAAYRKVLWHNLLAGWWGIPFGLIWTPLSLLKNRAALRKLRQQAAPPPQGA